MSFLEKTVCREWCADNLSVDDRLGILLDRAANSLCQQSGSVESGVER